MNSLIIKIVLVLLSLIFIGFIIREELVSDNIVHTENAQILGKVLDVKAASEGELRGLSVRKGEYLKAGQPLFEIDDSLLQVAISKSLSEVKIRVKEWSKQCRRKDILKLQETSAKELYTQKHREFTSAKKLHEGKFLSDEEYQNSLTALKISELNVEMKQVEYQNLVADITASLYDDPETKLALEKLKELFYKKRMLSIVSPVNGYVSDVEQFSGAWIAKGETVLTIISQDEVYVAANVLEKKIKRILPGHLAEVTLDIYGDDVKLKASVKAVPPATMSTFSVIPQNNINSNWIKVSQRIPVLLELKNFNSTPQLPYAPIGGNARIKIFTDQVAPVDEIRNPDLEKDTSTDGWTNDYFELIKAEVIPFVKNLDVDASC